VSFERDTYADVGAALRRTVRQAVEVGCTRKELRALLGVFELTASYSRLEDRLYVQQLADVADLHIVDARASLRSLRDKGVIVFEGKRGARSLIGLRGEPASFSSTLRGEPASYKEAIRGGERSRIASRTEKVPEETSEERAIDWIDSLNLGGGEA
jgi:hypothetical protein